jgi:hypothetical protein
MFFLIAMVLLAGSFLLIFILWFVIWSFTMSGSDVVRAIVDESQVVR